MQNLDHSLAHAVRDGTISHEAAWCGLSPADLDRLAAAHPDATLLVRLRGPEGDSRYTMPARYAADYCPRTPTVRDVLALAAGTRGRGLR